MEEFKTVLKAIMLRRKGEVVLKDLPPIWWQTAPVEIDNWSDRKHIDDPRQAEAVDMILAHSLTNQDLAAEIESIAPHIASLRRLTGVAKVAQRLRRCAKLHEVIRRGRGRGQQSIRALAHELRDGGLG